MEIRETPMDATAAATTAGVTIATIRRWCRYGAIAAVKVAGRWVIEAASLARRITMGAKNVTTDYDVNDYTKIRVRFDSYAGQYVAVEVINGYERSDSREGSTRQDAYENLLGWISRRDGLTDAADALAAAGLYADLTGSAAGIHQQMQALAPSPARADECHYCGLNPRTCDCH